jgi:site-specific DNA recombinase
VHPERPRDPAGVTRDPAGVTRDPAGVTCDPVAAGVVAEIFARYGEPSAPLEQVARALPAQYIRSPPGRECWGLSTRRGLLSNPVYVGQVYAGRLRYRPPQLRRSATHPLGRPHDSGLPVPQEAWISVASAPAIVTPEQFDLIQTKVAQTRAFARRHNTSTTSRLRALLSWGVCRLACTGRTVNHQHAY